MVRSERDGVMQRSRQVGQCRESERDNSPCRIQNATGGYVAICPESAAYWAIAFSGLELEEHGMKLDQAFSLRISLLLGILSTSSKP
ncbi:hypothetical protein Taro_026973 [Colocasia esculenta]|uniref:Uncharacterized protein n=1 Tax=Colocasia esculenta TaxID=4460 RepID=A0A843VCS7_COLES|nr:hypothetical protein [Colocasia esculenta]